VLKARRLVYWRGFRQRHKDNPREVRVTQLRQQPADAVWNVAEVSSNVPVIRFGRVEQEQGMSCRGSVYHHETMVSLVNATRESAEYRNLLRTWRAQILLQQRLAFFVEISPRFRHHFLCVGACFRNRVNTRNTKTGDVSAQSQMKVRRGIGGGQMDAMPAACEFHS